MNQREWVSDIFSIRSGYSEDSERKKKKKKRVLIFLIKCLGITIN